MWFAVVAFFILWILSIRLLMPVPVIYTFFTAMLVMAITGVRERYVARHKPE